MGNLKFLNLSEESDYEVWEKLVQTRSEALHECQFQGEEKTCPAFQNDSFDEQDWEEDDWEEASNICDFVLITNWRAKCELLPEERTV